MPAVLVVVELAFLPGEDDGVVAGIYGREGPKKPTMAVTPEAVSSRLNDHAYGCGGCYSRQNMSQLVGVDGAITPELVVEARSMAPCR